MRRRISRSQWYFGPNVWPPKGDVRSKRLEVCNEYWVAGAIWEKHGAEWVCVKADEIIGWMKGMGGAEAKKELARMGAQWSWS